MWISRAIFDTMNTLIESAQNRNTDMLRREGALTQQVLDLKVENQRLISTQEWFKHRLTQVESERAQLIYAATGGTEPLPRQVKIAAPNFVGEPSVSDVLNQQNNPFGTLGDDSDEPGDQIPAHLQEYPNLPKAGK